MQYKQFKDISLSRLGMGNMRLPVDSKKLTRPIDREKAQEIIDYAMENGVNYYDTAWVYHMGESENFLGEALKKYDRASYHLATKFFLMANANYKEVFEKQLAKLQTDYIDFYLVHSIMDLTWKRYAKCGCIEYFKEQQKAGRIKYLGFSSHASTKVLRQFADLADWDFAQIQLNYFDYLYGTAKEQYEILTERNIPVMVMESVRGGKLSDLGIKANAMLKSREPERSISSWALRYLMSFPNVQVILSGMSTLDQIKDNVATFSTDCALDEAEKKYLYAACDVFHKGVAVPCTACRYCTDDCPKQIDIPQVMSYYNAFKTEGEQNAKEHFGADAAVSLTASAATCIACKSCERHCPQSIRIADIMKKVR